MLEASVLLRDALLDPDVTAQAEHRQSIERAYSAVDTVLMQYVPFLDSAAERERVDRLRAEIREFRLASDEVLATDSSRWPAEARTLLRRFMPKRESAIRVSDEVQALNRAAFIDQQRDQTGMQAEMQRQVWTVFGVALGISMVIGWLVSQHAAWLERRLTEQNDREERIASDFQRLSARLVHAREEEQRRIARELHDDVGQALSAVKVQLAVAERRIETMGAARALLADAQTSADAALHSVRDLSHLLHPSALDDLGLVAALESLVADFRRRHQIAVEFVHRGAGSPSARRDRARHLSHRSGSADQYRAAFGSDRGRRAARDRSLVGPRDDRGQRHRIRRRRRRTSGQAARARPPEHSRACHRAARTRAHREHVRRVTHRSRVARCCGESR